jgi:TolB protein
MNIRYLLAVALLVATMAGSARAALRETIVYSALRPTNWDIYLFESRSSSPRRLTDDAALDYNAVFSPDGRWVVFCSERRGGPDLYALDLKNAGPPRLLIDSPALEDAPAFSPDGRRLAFVSTRDGNADIFVVPFHPEKLASHTELVNLTRGEGGEFNPAFSPDGRQIAFSSDRDTLMRLGPPGTRESDLYVMDADGSNVKRLTSSKGWEGSPAWSKAGREIYFYAVASWQPLGETRETPRIFRMNSDGSDARVVSSGGVGAISPALTGDGRVAFAANIERRWQIVSVAADGSDQRMESDAHNEYWAPDFDRNSGKMVCHGMGPIAGAGLVSGQGVFGNVDRVPFFAESSQMNLPDRTLDLKGVRSFTASVNPETGEIVGLGSFNPSDRMPGVLVSRPDGTGLKEVFKAGGPAWGVVWSKDGKWIAFTAGPPFAPPRAQADIWKMRADGSNAVNLTEGCAANDGFPDFSRDGRRIVFRSGRDGNHEIYLMDADGRNVHRLTDNPQTDTMPAFSPVGDVIAFASMRDGNFEIYTLELNEDASPGRLRRITNSSGTETHPRFSPDGKWVIFASDRGGNNDEEPLNPAFTPQPSGEIWAVRLEDGLLVRLTHNKWEDGVPTWSGAKVY